MPSTLRSKRYHAILAAPVLTTVLAAVAAFAADYERQSVSYLRYTLCLDDKTKLSPEEDQYFLDAVDKHVRLVRFDLNPLPDYITNDFSEKVRKLKPASAYDLGDLLTETVADEILQVLDLNKEARAKLLVSEAERNSFVATKAKDLGITAEDLEKVMNSAHVFVPVILSYEVTKTKDRYSVALKGGIAWYRVLVEGGSSSIVFLKYVTATPAEREPGIYAPRTSRDKMDAFRKAVDDFGTNLELNLRAVPEISLHGPVVEARGGTVWFRLGSNEGVSKDERYRVVETSYLESGTYYGRTVGFIRVVSVGDNGRHPEAVSKGKQLLGGGFEKGMSVEECAQSLHPFYFAVDVIPLKFGAGYIEADGVKYFEMISEKTTRAVALVAGGMNDLANDIGLCETYLAAELEIGLMNPDFQVYNQYYATGLSLIGALNGGLTKKFYYGPVALAAGARYGALYMMTGVRTDTTSATLFKPDYGLSILATGPSYRLGLEVCLDVQQSIGFGATYMDFKPADKWALTLKGNKKSWASSQPPCMEVRGFGFNAYYSKHF